MEYNKVNERIQITLQPIRNNEYRVSLSTSRLAEFIPSTVIHLSPEEIEKLNSASVAAEEKVQNLASSISSEELEAFGRSLSNIIFQDEIINEFLTTLEKSPIDRPLSLAIKVPEELASIWWELLYLDNEIAKGFFSLNESIYFS